MGPTGCISERHSREARRATQNGEPSAKTSRSPGKQHKKKDSILEPYKPTIDRLLSEGVWNAVMILREIQAEGYKGEISLVRLYAPPQWVFGYDVSGYGAINGALIRRDFELAGFAWVSDADPQLAPLYACGQVPSEFNGWQGNNYIGDNTVLTQAERKAHYAVVQEQFAQDMPSLPLFLRYPVTGDCEHLDLNLYTLEKSFLPMLIR